MRVQLNKIMFVLPARTFIIDYTVSEKRQLPVVKEFVVRLLYSTDGADPGTLKKYFGFSESELNAVLDDLLEESLVEWDDERIVLTQYASGKFEEYEGRMIPRFFEVVDKFDSVSFELHDFKMLPPEIRIGGDVNCGVSLNLPNESFQKLNDKAQVAFDSSFDRFRESIKKEDIFSERQELYKINQVTSKYDCVVPVEVEYYVDSSAPTELKTSYVSSVFDSWDQDKSLFTTMDDCIPRLTGNNNDEFLTYLEDTSDPFLLKYWLDDRKTLDYEAILNHMSLGLSHEGEDTQMILGNLYMDSNSDAILNKLKSVFDGKKQSVGFMWFSNSDSATWGRTTSFESFFSALRDNFDRRLLAARPLVVLSCGSSTEAYELNRIYGRLDAGLAGCLKRFGGSSSEVLLIPNVMVACLYHSELDDHRNIQFPVGFVSFDDKKIKAVQSKVKKWFNNNESFNEFFEKNTDKKKDTFVSKVVSPLIEGWGKS